MTPAEIRESQRKKRAECLQAILDSTEPKKLIVAGAGTGKTFTFREVLKPVVGGTNPCDEVHPKTGRRHGKEYVGCR